MFSAALEIINLDRTLIVSKYFIGLAVGVVSLFQPLRHRQQSHCVPVTGSTLDAHCSSSYECADPIANAVWRNAVTRVPVAVSRGESPFAHLTTATMYLLSSGRR